ncbi:MAG: hypothetical protein ACRCYU_21905 [Nocardioides sp.]
MHSTPSSTEHSPIPWGRTARRLDWALLPPHLRKAIERRLGWSVTTTISQPGGFTPGFASVLTGPEGQRVFVKAASCLAQRAFADAYRIEAGVLAALPARIAAPGLLWTIDQDWVVLAIEHVDAVAPKRPWTRRQLTQCLDAIELTTRSLTPAPAALDLPTAVDELAAFPSCWEQLAAAGLELPHWPEAADLAGRMADAVGGNSVVHADIRDDNLLIDRHRRVWICDWNWPFRGAPWLDSLMLLIQAHGDGLGVADLLAERPNTREVPGEEVDIVLAVLAGYYLWHGALPSPTTSPWLRAQQAWMGESAWRWLRERRGWPADDDLGQNDLGQNDLGWSPRRW